MFALAMAAWDPPFSPGGHSGPCGTPQSARGALCHIKGRGHRAVSSYGVRGSSQWAEGRGQQEGRTQGVPGRGSWQLVAVGWLLVAVTLTCVFSFFVIPIQT